VLRLLRGAVVPLLTAVVLVAVPVSPASGATIVNITQPVLAGDNVTLTGSSVIDLPSGTTTYRGVLSGHGILTVAGDGTLVLTEDSDFTLPATLQRQSVTTSGGNWPYPIITGTISNGTGMNFGGAAFWLSLPAVAAAMLARRRLASRNAVR
jgi:hypothetical protein